MLNGEREQEIINILRAENGFVTVRSLCDALFASESSVRRDLKSLEERGLVKRSYGGASPVNHFSNIVTFNRRTRQNINAKRQIAEKAASLIEDGNIIFLDQSSTAFYLADEIINRSSVTVVTNNIEIMMLLAKSNIKVISSGGVLSSENRCCLVGKDASDTFKGVFADIMFFSVMAVSDDGTATDCSKEEIDVRLEMLKNADKKVLLCDSTKFGTRAPFRQCELRDTDCLISEEDKSQRFASYGSNLILL